MCEILSIYIIYHKSTFIRNTSEFSETDLKKYFKWVAVNEKIPKLGDTWIPKCCLLKEWEFPKFFGGLQENSFYQNSVFFHLYWNHSYINTKYIGFAQYDMSISANGIKEVLEIINSGEENIVFGAFASDEHDIVLDYFDLDEWNTHFMNQYNLYYSKNHAFNDVKNVPLLLMHTFIIPTNFFIRMMKFIERLHINIIKALDTDMRNFAGIMERIFALCISFGIIEGELNNMYAWNNVLHNSSQHTGDSIREIEVGSENNIYNN